MPEITSAKMAGVFTQTEHHKIAAALQVISDKWDEQEALTGVRPADAYDYSLGLVMERDLFYSAVPDKLKDLEDKIKAVKVT